MHLQTHEHLDTCMHQLNTKHTCLKKVTKHTYEIHLTLNNIFNIFNLLHMSQILSCQSSHCQIAPTVAITSCHVTSYYILDCIIITHLFQKVCPFSRSGLYVYPHFNSKQVFKTNLPYECHCTYNFASSLGCFRHSQYTDAVNTFRLYLML